MPSTPTLGEDIATIVRDVLARSSQAIARALAAHPQAVLASESPRAQQRRWIAPSPFRVLVLTEYGIGDPYADPTVHAAFDRAVGKLLKVPLLATAAGWDSINPAVQVFWIKPMVVA